MKASSGTSATATQSQLRTGRLSARRTPTLTSGDSFSLSGPSDPPDPDFNAFRKDLADAALAGQVIASHYADPLDWVIVAATDLRSAPAEDGEIVGRLEAGEPFALLDDTLGWAWGYAGVDRRVGYVRSETVGAA